MSVVAVTETLSLPHLNSLLSTRSGTALSSDRVDVDAESTFSTKQLALQPAVTEQSDREQQRADAQMLMEPLTQEERQRRDGLILDQLIAEIELSHSQIVAQQLKCPSSDLAMSRWSSLSKQVVDTLASDRQWATTASYADLVGPSEESRHRRDAAQVWELTEAELQQWIDSGRTLDATIVVRGANPNSQQDFDRFLTQLKRYSFVDVQDLAKKPEQVVSRMSTSIVNKRVRRGPTRIDHCSLPLNLLNMEDVLGLCKRGPAFLSQPRFKLLSEICARLKDQPPKGGPFTRNPGKRDFVEACEEFSIFAQRGAFSGPHCDALVGTWVYNVKGVKAWPILPNLDRDEATEYETRGSFWQPRSGQSKMIVLHEGDTLVMPAGRSVIHCPLTLEDCYMVGGMFWDDLAVLDILLGIWWTAKAPVITNEPFSRQMPEVLAVLRSIITEKPDRFLRSGETLEQFLRVFDSRLEAIRVEGSCECCSAAERCRCRWERCKCRLYRDKCNEWCHARKAAAMQARRRSGAAPKSLRSQSSVASTSAPTSLPVAPAAIDPTVSSSTVRAESREMLDVGASQTPLSLLELSSPTTESLSKPRSAFASPSQSPPQLQTPPRSQTPLPSDVQSGSWSRSPSRSQPRQVSSPVTSLASSASTVLRPCISSLTPEAALCDCLDSDGLTHIKSSPPSVRHMDAAELMAVDPPSALPPLTFGHLNHDELVQIKSWPSSSVDLDMDHPMDVKPPTPPASKTSEKVGSEARPLKRGYSFLSAARQTTYDCREMYCRRLPSPLSDYEDELA